jgi:hypothetical protein
MASYLRFILDYKFRVAMYATGVVIVGLWITGESSGRPTHSVDLCIGIFVTIFQCRPVSAAWDFTIRNGKCISFVDYLYASSSISVTTDIILCVMPWPYLWKLRMPLKQKLILCLLFGGGAG